MIPVEDDYANILRLAHVYAFCLDTRNWEGLNEVFDPGASMEFHGIGVRQGLDAIIEVCADALTPLAASQPQITTQDARITGEEATGISYFQAQHVANVGAGVAQYIVAGTYQDRLRKTPEGWRVVHRVQSVTWTDGDPAVLSAHA